MFYDILKGKNAFLPYNKNKLRMSKNYEFSKGVSPWFWSKISHSTMFSFSGNLGPGKCVFDILGRKNAFLGYKNKKLKKSKN